jgi:hypothetical protein
VIVGTDTPPSGNWWHCSDPEGYYPYVATCVHGWAPVAVTPSAGLPYASVASGE